jgi:hypothetical protein
VLHGALCVFRIGLDPRLGTWWALTDVQTTLSPIGSADISSVLPYLDRSTERPNPTPPV